ncbi:MAG: dockerin type I repeat-containing protein [Clostridia bacterium]|nr:dockerin type I repeat-containing protein [Clostridia bacterium]
MSNKISRKVISCILAVVMLFSISATAFAAQENKYDNPVIVINGIANNPLYANPGTTGATQVFPPSDLTMIAMTAQMFIDGIVAIASNEYEEIMNFFVGSQVYEMLEVIQLNPDGTSMSENLGPIIYDHALSYYYTDTERFETIAGNIGIGMCDRLGADNVYVYNYDWRLDPIESARGLHDFIQTVKANSRREQVSIISEGFGSTVATAYLAECYEDATADVDNFVTVNSAFMGTSLIGDLFTGRLIRQYNELQNATSAFIRYTNDFSDNPVTWFPTWLVNYILNKNWETQDFIASIITMMGHIVDPLYDNYLRDMLKNFTGLWAMVPVEYYEEAMDFMFMSDASTSGDFNSDFQEKIQTFKNYQSSAADILNKAKSEGININVVSCWDIQLVPIGDNKASDEELFGLSAQSDGLIDTYYSSFGCYTIPLNDVGAAAQNKDQRNQEGECANHNHLNAVYDTLNPEGSLSALCHYLDASTCALPDNTWFIRNMKFNTFDTASNSMNFLEYLVTADKTLTVYSGNGLYRQFMFYNRYLKPGFIDVADIPNVPGTYLLGDVNLDTKVNAADARLALRISARLEKYPEAGEVVFMNADVNGDGLITAADARIILRVSAGLASFDDYKNTTDQ